MTSTPAGSRQGISAFTPSKTADALLAQAALQGSKLAPVAGKKGEKDETLTWTRLRCFFFIFIVSYHLIILKREVLLQRTIHALLSY
jgi:hypothetical protein